MHTIQNKKLLMLRPRDIKIPLFRARKCDEGYSLYSLAESIKQSGIIEPLVIRKNENGKYELICGERRLKAAIMAGLRRVPCVLHDIDSSAAAVFSVIENFGRKNLSFFEEAEVIKQIIVKHRITQAEMAQRLGVSNSALLERLRLLRLGDHIRSRIEEAGLSESHARTLLRVVPEKREEVLESLIDRNMTALQAEVYVNEMLSPKPTQAENIVIKKPPQRKSAIGDIRLFSNSLQKLAETLKNSGIDAYTRRTENDRYIEYKVRIKKDEPRSDAAEQLRIC